MVNIIEQIKRSFAIAKKNLKIYYNKPPVVITSLLFPIILLFAFTIGRELHSIYIVSGLTAMTLFFAATSIPPITLAWETMQKTLERKITAPVSIKTILLGDIWACFLFGSVFATVTLFLTITFLSLWSSINLFIVLLAIFLASFVFSCFSTLLSIPPTQTPQEIMVFTVLIKFIFVIISPLFMPIQSSPIAIISPLTYFVDIINYGISGESNFGAFGILIDFCVVIIFGLICLLIAFKMHQKTLQKRFRG